MLTFDGGFNKPPEQFNTLFSPDTQLPPVAPPQPYQLGVMLHFANKVTTVIEPDGDAFFTSDLTDTDTYALSIFTNAQSFNGESMAAGDALFGTNSAGFPNLRWDSLNGNLLLRIGVIERIKLASSGVLTINDADENPVFTFNATAGAEFTKPLTIGASGGIYQGTGSFGLPSTGLKIWNDSGIGRIAGYDSGTIQWSANSSGKFEFAGGVGILDAAGLTLTIGGIDRTRLTTGGELYLRDNANNTRFEFNSFGELLLRDANDVARFVVDSSSNVKVNDASGTTRFNVDSAGILTLNDSTGSAVLTFDASAGAEITSPLTLGLSGGIYQGTGTFTFPTTGLKIWNSLGMGRIAGYNSGVEQWGVSSDGILLQGNTARIRFANSTDTTKYTDLHYTDSTNKLNIISSQGAYENSIAVEANYSAATKKAFLLVISGSATSAASAELGDHTSSSIKLSDGAVSIVATNGVSVNGTTTFTQDVAFSSALTVTSSLKVGSGTTRKALEISNGDAVLYVGSETQDGDIIIRNTSGTAKHTFNGATGNGDMTGTLTVGVALGVGVTPLTTLHVSDSNGGAGITVGNRSVTNYQNQYQYINFGSGTAGEYGWQLGKKNNVADAVGPSLGFYIYDIKNSVPRFVIDTSGNIGIGTTSPSTNSDGTGPLLAIRNTAPGVLLENTTASVYWLTWVTTAGDLRWYESAANSDRMTLDKNGNLRLYNTASVPAAVASTAVMYCTGGEMWMKDAAGNATQQTPHNFKYFKRPHPAAWAYYSYNFLEGYEINVDMFSAIQDLEKLTKKKYMYINQLDSLDPLAPKDPDHIHTPMKGKKAA